MYKNIGADTAGVALWEVADENWPDETGQLSIIWVLFVKPCRRKEQLDFGTWSSWCFYLQGNALVIFMVTISAYDYKHSVVLVLTAVGRTKHGEPRSPVQAIYMRVSAQVSRPGSRGYLLESS